MNRREQFERFHKSWMEINAAYERYARELGISYSLLQVLCELYRSESAMTQRAICETCHFPKTTVNAIVSGLANQGYATLQEIPQDRRRKAVVLTGAGRDYAAPIMERMGSSELRAFEMLDEETIRVMLEGMEAYQKYFNEKLNQADGGKHRGEF